MRKKIEFSGDMKIPHPIPYQGSKRNLATQILTFFPKSIDKLFEPFAGSAAISIASAYHSKTSKYVINDINKPLIDLWKMIIEQPAYISEQYDLIWNEQFEDTDNYYLTVREEFNKTKRPELLLFILAKCVKGAVRYNTEGNFNQSADKRRSGKNPLTMKKDIFGVSNLLKSRIEFFSSDFNEILDRSTENDLVYMDPPYQGTGKNGGFNYAGNIKFDSFIQSLERLNQRNVPFLLSFDGRTGDKIHGTPLPKELRLHPFEIKAGRSTQATLLNRNEHTVELLYISQSLINKIDFENVLSFHKLQEQGLFANYYGSNQQ